MPSKIWKTRGTSKRRPPRADGGAAPRAPGRPPRAQLPGAGDPAALNPWPEEIAGVLIGREALAKRVRALAREIERDFAGRDLVVVALLNGTIIFLADLLRELALPLRLDFIGVSSYRDGRRAGELALTKELMLDVRRRDVLLVDDILDTGRTLACVLRKLRQLRPRRLRVCVLLDKPSRRTELVRAHYVGFQIPDLFVVGYGLDFAEKYRNLPFLGILRGASGAA